MPYGVANQLGKPCESEASEILKLAVRSRVDWFDTARCYGDAETRIGHHVGNNKRVHVATKLRPLDNLSDDASQAEVLAAVDSSILESSKQLQRNKIDVVMFHRSRDMFAWNGVAMNQLWDHVENDRVGTIGASVYSVDEAMRCLADKRIKHIQIPFNVLDSRWLRREFLDSALSKNIDIHVRSVFLQGLLVSDVSIWPKWNPDSLDIVKRLTLFANKFGRLNRTDLCMAYVRSFPWVSKFVIGIERISQLQELLGYMQSSCLTQEERDALTGAFDPHERLLNPSQW